MSKHIYKSSIAQPEEKANIQTKLEEAKAAAVEYYRTHKPGEESKKLGMWRLDKPKPTESIEDILAPILEIEIKPIKVEKKQEPQESESINKRESFSMIGKKHMKKFAQITDSKGEYALALYIYSQTYSNRNLYKMKAISKRRNTINPVGFFTYIELVENTFTSLKTVYRNLDNLVSKNIIHKPKICENKKIAIEFESDDTKWRK